jgi:hypothetical protein
MLGDNSSNHHQGIKLLSSRVATAARSPVDGAVGTLRSLDDLT